MIIISAVLVIVAIGLLTTGAITSNLTLIYASIGISIVSAVFLAVGSFLRRAEVFGGYAPAGYRSGSKTAARARVVAGRKKTARPATKAVRTKGGATRTKVPAGKTAAARPAFGSSATDVPGETLVFVVPGRKRYHLQTCRQLTGKSAEEVTYEEAHEEGFTPCSACVPDTALAARTSSVPEQEQVDSEQPATDDIDTGPAAGSELGYEDEESAIPWDGDDARASDEAGEDTATIGAFQLDESDKFAGADDTTAVADEDTSVMEAVTGATEDAGSAPHAEDKTASAVKGEPQRMTQPDESEAGDADVADEAADEAVAQEDSESLNDSGELDGSDDEASVAAATEADSGAASRSTGQDVSVVSGRKRYHRHDCDLVQDAAHDDTEVTTMSRGDVQSQDYKPCQVCQPDHDPARR